MRFWLDKGADGFRVDMADSLVKNDDEKIATAKFGVAFVKCSTRNTLKLQW